MRAYIIIDNDYQKSENNIMSNYIDDKNMFTKDDVIEIIL